MRRRPRRVLLLAASAAVVVVLIWALSPAAVQVVSVERREVVATLVATGRVRSVSRASVGLPLGGRVAEVLAREGERVERGTVLLRLDDAEARASADEARARVVEAEAALRRVVSVDLPTTAAELEAAQLEARQRRTDVDRLRTLYGAGAVSRSDVEGAERIAESAEARYEAARVSARSLESGGADRRRTEAAAEQAREARRAALARLELTRVRAPSAGRVLIRRVEPGDVVSAGQVLMELALDGPTDLIVFPDERVLGMLRPDQPARASADAFPEATFGAHVRQIAPVVDPQQGTVEVWLAVPAPPAYLIPDMTVSVNIELARRPNTPTLPIDAVRAPLADSAWVLAVRDGRAVRVPVALGLRDARYVEIVGGLRPGDQVVVGAGDSVQPGDRVRARGR